MEKVINKKVTKNCNICYLNGIKEGRKEALQEVLEILDNRYLQERKIGLGTGEFWYKLKEDLKQKLENKKQ